MSKYTVEIELAKKEYIEVNASTFSEVQ